MKYCILCHGQWRGLLGKKEVYRDRKGIRD